MSDLVAGHRPASYINYMKQALILTVLVLSTGCARFGTFYAKSHYVGDKVPVYNASTGKVQYVYSPYAMPNTTPAPGVRP